MFTIWIYVCQLSIDSIRLYIYGIILCCIAALHCTWSSSAWDPRWLTYLSQTNVLLCGQTMVIYLIVYISHTILLKCCVGVQCALNLWPGEWIPSEQFWKSHFFIRSYSSTQFHTAPCWEFCPRTETSIEGLLLVVIIWSTQTVFMYLHTVFIHSAVLFALFCWSTNGWASFDRWGSPLLSDTSINIFQNNLSTTGTKVFEAPISIEASYSVAWQIHRLVKKNQQNGNDCLAMIYDALSKA